MLSISFNTKDVMLSFEYTVYTVFYGSLQCNYWRCFSSLGNWAGISPLPFWYNPCSFGERAYQKV